MRKHLTKRVVDAAKPAERDEYVWDTTGGGRREPVKGFCLRIRPNGRRTFELKYKLAGRSRRMVLGSYGELTVQQAREKAREAKALVRAGRDPLAEKRQRERAAAGAAEAETVADLAQDWVEQHAQPRLKTAREAELRLRRHVIGAPLGRLRVEEVERRHVRDLYDRVARGQVPKRTGRPGAARRGGPREAEHLRVLLSSMFNWAVDTGRRPEALGNPARLPRGARIRPRRRERVVTADELPELVKRLDRLAESDPTLARFYRLLMLTGLRSSELRKRTWEDLDRQGRALYVGQTKAGRPRRVPLSAAALETVVGLPREVGSPFLFPSPTRRRPAAPVSQGHTIVVWRRLCAPPPCDRCAKAEARAEDCPRCAEISAEAPLRDLRLHDLRHGVATRLAEAGADPQSLQRALGHQSLATTMSYVHASDAGARAALEGLGEELRSAGIAGGER